MFRPVSALMQAPRRAMRGRPRLRPRSRLTNKLLLVLAALGPGLIAANAGNDAGGIATYASVGAKYGYDLLWMMVVITVSLIVVQEMAARMGAVTGKGLAELIRNDFYGLFEFPRGERGTLLDAGCGTGYEAGQLARIVLAVSVDDPYPVEPLRMTPRRVG